MREKGLPPIFEPENDESKAKKKSKKEKKKKREKKEKGNKSTREENTAEEEQDKNLHPQIRLVTSDGDEINTQKDSEPKGKMKTTNHQTNF